MHVHTLYSLPTRPHRWQIAGQGETRTYTHPCLPDCTDGRSPVRERHTVHTSLPTRPHRWQIASQGETHTYTHPCLPDRTDGRSPVRERHTVHTSLPTRPHRWHIAGQGERHTRTHIPAYQTAQMADHRSGRDTHVHTSLPTRPHRWQIASQGETHIHTSLPTRPHGWLITGQRGMGLTHVHTHPCLLYHVHTLWVHVLLKSKLRFAETGAGFDGLVV